MHRVDVVIRTRANVERCRSLLRAIGSVLGQDGIAATPIVVVNGDCADSVTLERVAAMAGVRLLLTEGDLKAAMLRGVSAVTTDGFAFLDDDDEYLPGGLAALAAALAASPAADLVVSNGYTQTANGLRRQAIADVLAVRANPLDALLRFNWLYNCGSLYRTTSFPEEWFVEAPSPMFFEWTWIAYKSALAMNISLIDDFTFLYNDTPCSLSKSIDMIRQEESFIERISLMPLPQHHRRLLQRKRSMALHALSDHFRLHGNAAMAWAYHCRSLVRPGGWRHLPYTRHLLAPDFLRRAATATARNGVVAIDREG